jgi:tetratricopeptide (TPR) repeat protein
MDIKRHLNDEPIVACPPSAFYKLQKLSRRHRTALRVAGAFIILLIAATIISSWQAVLATRARAEALAQKQRANEQAAVAEGVNQFYMEEVFGLADPKRFDRAGITLAEALDVAASKIDVRFPNDRRLQGIIRDRFGGIYIGIDRPQQAVEQLRKAVELRTSIAGGKDRGTLKSRSSLGWALYHAGRWGEARDVLEATLADQTAGLGGGHPETVETACRLSVVLMEIRAGWRGSSSDPLNDDKDLEVPRNAYRQGLAALGPRHPATLNAESSMAWVMRWRRDSAGALPYAREAALGLRETQGPDDDMTCWATYNYAVCLAEIGRADESAQELEPVLATRYRILGPGHRDTMITAWRLAESLRIAGKPERSLAVLEDMHSHLGEIETARTWQRGQKLLDLAGCYEALGRYDRAAELLACARKMYQTPPDQETQRHSYASELNRLGSMWLAIPEPHRDVGRAVEMATRACELTGYKSVPFLNTLLAALAQKGDAEGEKAVRERLRAAEAENTSRRAKEITTQLNGEIGATLPSLVEGQAQALKDQGRPQEAEKLFDDAVNAAHQKLGETNLILGDLMHEFGRFLLYQEGKPGPAAEQYLRALSIRRASTNDPLTHTLRDLGDALVASGQPKDAEPYLRQAVILYRKLLQREDIESTAFPLERLGDALYQQNRLPEAEQAYLDALAAFAKCSAVDSDKYAIVVRSLLDVMKAENKLTERDALCREILAQRHAATAQYEKLAPDKAHDRELWSFAIAEEALAELLKGLGQAREAEKAYLDAQVLWLKLVANSNTEDYRFHLAVNYDAVGNILRSAGRAEEALAAYQAAQVIWVKLVADFNMEDRRIHLGWTDENIGQLQQQAGRLDEAIEVYRQVLGVWRKLVADFDRQESRDHLSGASANLAGLLRTQGKVLESESLERELAERGNAEALNDLAWRLATSSDAKLRNGSNAVVYAERACAATSRTNVSYLDTLAATYAEEGQFAKAISTQNEAIALSQSVEEKAGLASRLKLYENNYPYRDDGELAQLAMLRLREGKFAEAEGPARECLAIRENKLPDDWRTFNARSMLGGSLLGQKKYAEAEALLLSGYEGVKQREEKIPADARSLRLKEALQRLVQLYEAMGQDEKATEWNAKLAALNKQPTETTSVPTPK